MYERLKTLRDNLFGPKDRPISKLVIGTGIAIILLIAIAIAPEVTYQRVAKFFGWAALASLVLALALEPSLPKRDGRFRTGFRDNARPKQKTKRISQIQKSAVVFSIVSGALWLLLRSL